MTLKELHAQLAHLTNQIGDTVSAADNLERTYVQEISNLKTSLEGEKKTKTVLTESNTALATENEKLKNEVSTLQSMIKELEEKLPKTGELIPMPLVNRLFRLVQINLVGLPNDSPLIEPWKRLTTLTAEFLKEATAVGGVPPDAIEFGKLVKLALKDGLLELNDIPENLHPT